MEKPVNLLIMETKGALIRVINESNLPISISSLMLETLLMEVKSQEQIHLKNESKEYQSYQDSLDNTTE